MTDANNNSGNNPPDPSLVVTVSPNVPLPQGQPGQALSWNGAINQWITVPITTSGNGGNTTGTWVVPGQTYQITISGGGGGGGGLQASFNDIDLAVPVVEKKKDSDGCTCRKCGEFYPYADPPEPAKFNCYSCRLVF